MDPLNTPAIFEVRSFTHSWNNREYSKKFGPSLDTPTLPFLVNFLWAYVRMDPANIPAKFEVPSFSRSWDNSDCIFGVGVANLQSRGRVGRSRSGMVPFERAFLTSYRLSIVTFHLSLRASKFPHVPLGVGGWPLGYEERRRWAVSVQLVSKVSNPCDPDAKTSQTDRGTDRQTDGRHATSIPRYPLVHRAVNTKAELSQRRPCDAPNMWVPRKISRVLTSKRILLPEICNGRLFRSILRTWVQNLKFVALPVPEIIGGTQEILAVPGYAHASFFPK